MVFSGAGQNQWSYAYPAASDAGHPNTDHHGGAYRSRHRSSTLSITSRATRGDAPSRPCPASCPIIVAQAIDKLHFKSPIDRKTLDDMVQRRVWIGYSYQHDDGGWGSWPDDKPRLHDRLLVGGMGQRERPAHGRQGRLE